MYRLLIRLVILFLIFPRIAGAQQTQHFQKELTLLKNILLANHFSPPAIDDSFSETVFLGLMEKLDPDYLCFTEKDIALLQSARLTIDDEFHGAELKSLDRFTKIYKDALMRSVATIEELSKTPFDFNTQEFFTADTVYAMDDQANKERWRLSMKLEMLTRLMEKKEQFKEMPDQESLKKHEGEVRQRVKAARLRPMMKILNDPAGIVHYVASLFFRSITAAFDPHSLYLSAAEIENYLTSISTKGYYFGFTIERNDAGDLVIAQLVPGGAAWNTGIIHTGDIIREIKYEGKELSDLTGLDLEEVNELLEAVDDETVEFIFSNVAGERVTVALKKEKLEDPENVVKSFILKGQQRIGYISLPGFYTADDTEGAHCANDVAKEILKLKRENIEGLILDVRFNGGGSLYEAVAMAGIFIDAGPVGILKEKNGTMVTVKDMNRGMVYDGPLVLLVNGMSASASEFLAAALQDYHRAIIVGGQTYGKATAQMIMPLDPQAKSNTNNMNIASGLGFASVTMEKIYRVTGKTAQRNGVTPDILLPDVVSQLPLREMFLPFALPADSIIKKVYYQTYSELLLSVLKDKSEARVKTIRQFQVLQAYGEWLWARQAQWQTSLNWAAFKMQTMQSKSMFARLDSPLPQARDFSISNPESEKQRVEMDPYTQQFTTQWINKLTRDISLEEAFNILCDYISIKARK